MSIKPRTWTCPCAFIVSIAALVAPAFGQTGAFMLKQGTSPAGWTGSPTTINAVPGQLVTVVVWFQDPAGLDCLSGYQILVPWNATGGNSGTVSYVNNNPGGGGGDSVFVNKSDPAWVFANAPGAAGPTVTYNETPNTLFGAIYVYLPGQCIQVGPGSSVPNPGGPNYVMQFDLQLSPDAAGPFDLLFNLAPASPPHSEFFNQSGMPYAGCVVAFQPLQIVVGSAVCGNSVVEPGEDCDGGECCELDCTYSLAECRPSGGVCDPAESCNGVSSACPPDVTITDCNNGDGCCPAGCNASEDSDCPAECLVNADCQDGDPCTTDICNAGVCAHFGAPPGIPCGSLADDGCTAPDTCDGNGNCLTNDAPDGTVCNNPEIGLNTCNAGFCGAPEFEATPLDEGGYIGSEPLDMDVQANAVYIAGKGKGNDLIQKAVVWAKPNGDPDYTLMSLPTPAGSSSTANGIACTPCTAGLQTCTAVGDIDGFPAAWSYEITSCSAVDQDSWMAESIPLPPGATGGSLTDVVLRSSGTEFVAGGWAMVAAQATTIKASKSNGSRVWEDLTLLPGNGPGTNSKARAAKEKPVMNQMVLAGGAEALGGEMQPAVWLETPPGSDTFVLHTAPLPPGEDEGVMTSIHWNENPPGFFLTAIGKGNAPRKDRSMVYHTMDFETWQSAVLQPLPGFENSSAFAVIAPIEGHWLESVIVLGTSYNTDTATDGKATSWRVDELEGPAPTSGIVGDVVPGPPCCPQNGSNLNFSRSNVNSPMTTRIGGTYEVEGGPPEQHAFIAVGVELPLSYCADVDQDGQRDDACAWYKVVTGACVAVMKTTQADIGDLSGACPPDTVCDGGDRFHALNCFANKDTTGLPPYPCESSPPDALNADAGSPSSCTLDAVCDANDAFHALNCFADKWFDGSIGYQCNCPPPGPEPVAGQPSLPAGPLPRLQKAGLTLRTPAMARPGDLIPVDVHLDTDLESLRGYQLHLSATGGSSTSGGMVNLELVDITVDTMRRDYAFAGVPGVWSAFNRGVAQMVAGLDDPEGVPTQAGSYLATFTYRVPKGASGTLVIELRTDGGSTAPQDRTFLFGRHAGLIDVISATPAQIAVVQTRTRHARPE